jgi:hypothetical protein
LAGAAITQTAAWQAWHLPWAPRPTTTTTTSTFTETTTTRSTTATTTTRTTTATTPGDPPEHVYGGQPTKDAFHQWLGLWRGGYYGNDINKTGIPDLEDKALPRAFRGYKAKVVYSRGGVASGVVSEGMGYAMMIEGFEAANGSKEALANGLSLARAWLGMVSGPSGVPHPLGGGTNLDAPMSALDVGHWPYGVSAIKGKDGQAASGVPAWKWPFYQCPDGCVGSASDADPDATLGLAYLAAALGYPDDFVDLVVRSVIAFASADLGFPDVYRTLPGGRRMFVVKGGSSWGGLLPPGGKYKSSQETWCYSPGYFAPGHYRVFRDFVTRHWKPAFEEYLPPHVGSTPSTLEELREAFDGAVVAGYNILYHASCGNGAVANWVGVQAACDSNTSLHCDGVPWAHTPYVGDDGGNCSTSGTPWGSYGPDAARAPWRIALDYVLYPQESIAVTMYDTDGHIDHGTWFNAKAYLNRFVQEYHYKAYCDGGIPHACLDPAEGYSPYKLAQPYDPKSKTKPQLTCDNVPVEGETWYAHFMSWPTFTAFVVPYDHIPAGKGSAWMDTFSSLCHFDEQGKAKGVLCSNSYFEASQEVICTQIMAGAVPPLPVAGSTMAVVRKFDNALPFVVTGRQAVSAAAGLLVTMAAFFVVMSGRRLRAAPRAPRDPRSMALYYDKAASEVTDGA